MDFAFNGKLYGFDSAASSTSIDTPQYQYTH